MDQTTSASLFSSIPPERVGVRGEYDYNGLANRVRLAFQQQFEPNEIAHLGISQRGAVVVLVGAVDNRRLLTCLVNVAMGVEGTVAVEINGVSLFQPLNARSRELDRLQFSSSYAF